MVDKRPPMVNVRLLAKDHARFLECCKATGSSQTDLARKAIVEMLDRKERGIKEAAEKDVDSEYAKQLKASTERICALMAKIGIEVHAVMEFLAMVEGGQEAMAAALSKSSKRIEQGLENQIQRVKGKMSELVNE